MKNVSRFLFLLLFTCLTSGLVACRTIAPIAYMAIELATNETSTESTQTEGGLDSFDQTSPSVDGGTLLVDTVTKVTIRTDTHFSVDVVAGESYLFAAQGGLDLQMELNEEGNTLAFADEEIEGAPEVIFYTAETDTTLTLSVAPYDRGAEALVAFATVVAQSNDTLTVEVTDGHIPLVTVESTEDVDPILMVGQDAIDESASGIRESYLMDTYPVGSVDVTVESYSGLEAPYNLAVAYLDPIFAEVGNLAEVLPETLLPLMLDTPTSVELNNIGYTFTIPDDGVYVVTATGVDKDVSLEIYDGGNRLYAEIDSAYDDESEFFILANAPGNYTVMASDLYGDDGIGTLSVRTLPVDDSQPDVATFTLTDSDPRPLLFAVSTIEEGYDMTLTIMDSAGNVITEIDQRYSSLEMFDTVNLPAGDYTATSDMPDPNSSRMGLIIPDESYARNGALPEDNQTLAIGDTFNASTDEGSFALSVTDEAPAIVLVKSDVADMVLSIYDENNILIHEVDNQSSGIAEEFAFMEAGTYTIVPSPYSAESAEFTISAFPMQVANGNSTEFAISSEMVTIVYALPGGENDVVLTIQGANGEEVEYIDWLGDGEAESFVSNEVDIALGTYTAEVTNWDEGDEPIILAIVQIPISQFGQ
ncbi:MAG: hypothetical protein AAF702_42970 [Chloroflexota bacterium]